MKKICKWCKKQFIPRSINQQFCSKTACQSRFKTYFRRIKVWATKNAFQFYGFQWNKVSLEATRVVRLNYPSEPLRRTAVTPGWAQKEMNANEGPAQ